MAVKLLQNCLENLRNLVLAMILVFLCYFSFHSKNNNKYKGEIRDTFKQREMPPRCGYLRTKKELKQKKFSKKKCRIQYGDLTKGGPP
ncbi:CLUMA_CG002101, isoform A [Clunio marinus]|uniref:CLUMA_CG002101, isoform A n=1 Tax=Clunio marinus TaxID=568069 RepID=A0A1J1HLA4_9DIPT|nr:CLUMA_CG002101, isoform A [Clunio marinus]